MQRYPVSYPSREQAHSLLTASITWGAVLELAQTPFNGRGQEWWDKYVRQPLEQWGAHAPYQAVSTYTDAVVADLAIGGSLHALSHASTTATRLAAWTGTGLYHRFAAYSAPLMWKLSRLALNVVLKITGRAGAASSLKAAGITAALPTGGWSILAALGGLAFDAWSVYEITILRRSTVTSILDALYP